MIRVPCPSCHADLSGPALDAAARCAHNGMPVPLTCGACGKPVPFSIPALELARAQAAGAGLDGLAAWLPAPGTPHILAGDRNAPAPHERAFVRALGAAMRAAEAAGSHGTPEQSTRAAARIGRYYRRYEVLKVAADRALDGATRQTRVAFGLPPEPCITATSLPAPDDPPCTGRCLGERCGEQAAAPAAGSFPGCCASHWITWEDGDCTGQEGGTLTTHGARLRVRFCPFCGARLPEVAR